MTRKTFKKLKRDGAYTGDHDLICGYSNVAAQRKEQFLRDASALLREVGKHLAQHGLTEMEIRRNLAGVAVSGEVTAEYWQSGSPCRRVWVEIGATCLALLSGRKDGASILARVQEYREPTEQDRRRLGRRHTKSHPGLIRCTPGPNQWLSPEFDSRKLADTLLKIYGPGQSPQNVAAHTIANGVLPIPSPVVSDEDKAIAWEMGHQAVEKAFRADQQKTL